MRFTCTSCGSEYEADPNENGFSSKPCLVCGSDFNVTGWGRKIKPNPWLANQKLLKQGGYQEDLDRFTLKKEDEANE